MNSRILRLLPALLLLFGAAWPASPATAAPPPISTNAQAAALIDVESGRLLYSSRGSERMRIASLTKIMTAIVAIEHGTLSDTVKVSKRAAGKEGSSIYLRVGEEMSLSHLLYGLMLRSGNDAATAIAEHVGGSEEGFVHLMNEKAAWMGLTDTHFMNPHGLDHDKHYSSANDLAKMTAYALRNATFRDIVKTRVKTVPNPNEAWDYKWTNKNKMLSLYDGADGVKTGYTKLAKRCLVSSATRDGQQLAAVTINDGDDWVDHRHLLDWGFAHYPLIQLAGEGQQLDGYPLRTGSRFRYPLAEGERAKLRTRLVKQPAEDIRYSLGDAGRLEYYLDGAYIGAVPLEAVPPEASSAESGRQGGKGKDASAADASRETSGRQHGMMDSLLAAMLALFGGRGG